LVRSKKILHYLKAELELGWILAGVQVAPWEGAEGPRAALGVAEGERAPKRADFRFRVSSVFGAKNTLEISVSDLYWFHSGSRSRVPKQFGSTPVWIWVGMSIFVKTAKHFLKLGIKISVKIIQQLVLK
jgi:hypothetical protein